MVITVGIFTNAIWDYNVREATNGYYSRYIFTIAIIRSHYKGKQLMVITVGIFINAIIRS